MPLRQASAALQDERAVPANGTGTTDLSLRLLDFLARSAEPVGLSELARQFQASKATIHRHLQTLAHHDFVRQDPATMRYAPGIKLFILGERLRERFDILGVARSEMVRLRDETEHAVALSTLVDDQVGTVLPLHASAHGKVALAFGPEDLLPRCLSRPLKAWTPHTVCTRAVLERDLAQIKALKRAAAQISRRLGYGGK